MMKLKRDGFTLVEVLMTVVVISIGIVASSAAFNAGLYAQTDAENMRTAMYIAQAQMEDITSTAFGSLEDSGPTADPDFPSFNVSVDVAEGQDPMQVDVTVTYPAKGGQASVVLTTLASDY